MFKTPFGAAFESGQYRGKSAIGEPIDYHQIEISRHNQFLAEDYKIAREEFGISCFRDGAWLQTLFLAPNTYNWSYLDTLADVSAGEAYLSICHYEWPRWITEEDIRSGAVIEYMRDLAREIAQRYKGRFLGYFPVIEGSYWTSRMTRDGLWWPAYGPDHHFSWWHMHKVVSEMHIQMARAIRESDPEALLGMSEPWNWYGETSFDDLARPFNTILGREDDIAIQQLGASIKGGSDDLVDIIGLNFYGSHGKDEDWPLHKIILEAQRRFPHKRIVIGETSFGFETHLYTAETWAEHVDTEVEIANSLGARVDVIFWAPFIDLFGDHLKPMPGGLVWLLPDDPSYTRYFDPHVAARFKRNLPE